MYYEEDTSGEDDLVKQLTNAGLKITTKRKCKSTKMKNAGNNIKLQPYKTLDLTNINIENLPFIEQLGDQYIESNSKMSLQSVTRTSQDINVQFNASPSKQPEDLTPLMCVPISSCTLTIAPTNVLSNQSPSKQHDASVPLFCAPHSMVNEMIEVPIDNKPNSSPNALSETLTSLCTTIALTTSEDALENGLTHQSRDKSPEANILLACLQPLSPSPIKAHTAEQTHPRPDDLSEASVQLVCLQPLSPSLIEAPAEDQPTPSLACQGNIQPSLSLEQTQSSTLPLSNYALSNNEVVILSDVPYHGDIIIIRLPIANRKYQDLQDLKPVIPERCHTFYDQLPHS